MKFKPYYSSGARTFYGMSTDELPENAVTGDRAHIINTKSDLICYEGAWFDLDSGKSAESKILGGKITISDKEYPLVLEGTEGSFTVPYGTDVTELLPTWTLSTGASISPSTAQDFSSDVTYTVTAADADYATSYIISVIVEDEPETEA